MGVLAAKTNRKPKEKQMKKYMKYFGLSALLILVGCNRDNNQSGKVVGKDNGIIYLDVTGDTIPEHAINFWGTRKLWMSDKGAHLDKDLLYNTIVQGNIVEYVISDNEMRYQYPLKGGLGEWPLNKECTNYPRIQKLNGMDIGNNFKEK